MKWTYVSKGHHSTPGEGGTVHVVGDIVYVTYQKRPTRDLTGSKADIYLSAVSGKTVAKPKPKTTAKTAPKKKPKGGKLSAAILKAKQIGRAAKPVVTKAKPVVSAAAKVGTLVASIGERVVTETPAAPQRTTRRPPTEHPLEYLAGSPSAGPDISYLSGAVAPARSRRRKPGAKKPRREQTLEEFMGF